MMRRCVSILRVLAVALLVGAAALLSVARAWLPHIDARRADVQNWVSEALGQPVQIDALAAEWRGLYPVLHLRGVRLLERDGGRTLLRFAELRVAVDPYAALSARRIRVHELSVIGARLSLERRADGVLSIAGLEEMPDAAPASTAVLAWLAAQPRISLLRSEVRWQDLRVHGAPLLFTAVDLRLENKGLRHRLAGAARLPASLGEHLRGTVDFRGEFARPGQWVGDLYLKARGLEVAEWLRGREIDGIRPLNGIADGELWGEFDSLRLRRVTGGLSLRNLRLAGDAVTTLNELGGEFAWSQGKEGWRINVENLRLARAAQAWPKSGFNLSVRRNPDGTLQQIDAGLDFLRAQDVSALALRAAALPDTVRNWLTGLALHGTVRNARFQAQFRNGGMEHYYTRAQLDALNTSAWGRLPAVAGVSGLLECNERDGRIQLDSRNVRVDLPGLFRLPLQARQVSGVLGWRRYGNLWRIQADDVMAVNADVQTHTRIALDLPHDGRPFMDLQTIFKDGDMRVVSRYLPAGIMSAGVVSWLDRAFVGGHIIGGTALFHGHLADFPFDNHDGVFLVSTDVEKAELYYQQGWPHIEAIKALVNFSGRAMHIDASSGRIYAATIASTRVSIADLTDAQLQIDGSASTSNPDLLRFVRETRLSSRYGDYLAALTAQGDSHLSLSMALPLARHEDPPKVAGRVDFTDATLALPEWNLALEDVTGPLQFTHAGLSSEGLTARLFGNDARITGRIRESGPDAGTTLELRGRADIGALARLQPGPAWRLLEGGGDFRTTLYFSARHNAPARLGIESSLRGVRVKLPAPLGKAAGDARQLDIQLPLTRAPGAALTLAYGDVLHGALVLHNVAGKTAVARGELRVGGAPARLPDNPGLRIAGELPQLDVETWRAALTDATGSAAAQLPEDIAVFDLGVQEFRFDGRALHALHLQAERQPEQWSANVSSDELAGQIQVPLRYPEGGPLIMNLEHLRIAKVKDNDGTKPVDPRSLPALQIRAGRFEYDERDFGVLNLNTVRTAGGMHVDQALVEAPGMKFSAQGDWLVEAGAQASHFNITLTAPELGKLLGKFGYVGNIKDGKTTAKIRAGWPGSPARFALERMQGELKVNIKDGRFVDIEPGAGRVFGLLSVNELQRRLRLDFSDLFSKGYSFDEITGDFTLSNGDAFTRNLTIKGPAARIEVSGRTGLIRRDYEQLVTVTPNLTASLPIAGVLANPGIGAALFVAQQLFKGKLDELGRSQYTVRGSWDKPVMEPVARNAPPANR